MAEMFSNLAETTTVDAINNTTDPVTFTVNTPAYPLPVAAVGGPDYFHAVVDVGSSAEILLCQRSGNTITGARAQEGTTKLAHPAGSRFAHAVTASSIQQIPAYPQTSTLTTKGDIPVRTATGWGRFPVGANGTVPIADSTSTGDPFGMRWGTVGGPGSGTAWQEPDYTIYYDGTNYSARNEKTAIVDYTSNTSLHNVFNSAAAALGTGTTFAGTGGLIALSTPTNHVMTTTAPLVMQNQLNFRGTGRGCIVRAGGAASNWNTGTLNAPRAVVDAHLKSRVIVENVAIDCNGITGTTGILFEKGTGSTGGNDAHSYFLFNEVRGFTLSGIQIGAANSTGATSTAWLFGNQVVDDVGSTARGVCFFVGDCHYGWGNNIKMSSSNGYPMYIGANSVHILNGGHMVNNSNCPNALVTVVGGNPCRIEGVYFDNLRNFPAVDLNPSGSGVSNRVTITNNWCHLTTASLNALSVFRLNAVNGGCSGITIANNIGESDTEALRGTSIVDITNPASGAKIQNSLAMYGNQFQHISNFITANNGPTTGAGSAAVGVGMNIIEDSNTGGGSNGTTIRVGP